MPVAYVVGVPSGGAPERRSRPPRSPSARPAVRVVDDRLAAGDDDPHDRRPADTERGRDPRHRAVSGADLLDAHARARSVRHARGSIAGCSSVQVFLGHNACGQHQTRLCQHTTTGLPPIGRSRTHTARRSFGRATAPQSGHGTTRAMVSTSSSSSPPASAAASTRNPSNPNNPATTEPVTSASTWGSSTIRVILVVITDRASPRPTISSFQSPRRVARSPHSQVRGEEPEILTAADPLPHSTSPKRCPRSKATMCTKLN